MHSVAELLLGTLPVKLPGNPSGIGGDPGGAMSSPGAGSDAAASGLFSLLLSSEQHSLGPMDPLLARTAGAESLLDLELPTPPTEDAVAALIAPLPLDQTGLSRLSSVGSAAEATGSALPSAAAAGGSMLPGLAGWLASHEAAGLGSVAADAGPDQPGAASDGDRLLQNMLRRVHGQEAPFGAGPETLESTRGLLSSNGRLADGLPAAAADAMRPAGADQASVRVPAAELAMLAAAVDPRPAAERLSQPGSRHSRSEPSRAAEHGGERSGAPGAEGFEQQLRASALRTVTPVSVARDIGMIAERIEMLMHRRGDFANVNLNLGDLGDLQISVRMEARQAHISFLTQDASVRESLEQQLPRLRSQLEQSGVDVGNIDMDLPGQSAGEQGSARDRDAATAARRDGTERESAGEPAVMQRSGDGHHIIDAFA